MNLKKEAINIKKEELVKGLTYLGMAYNKKFTEQECSQYYEFLKDYNYSNFVETIKYFIKTSKFLPKIADLIEEMDSRVFKKKHEILNFMYKDGYFKYSEFGKVTEKKEMENYNKAEYWLENGTAPYWLEEDIRKYYKKMYQNQLENQELKMIESGN